MGYDYHANFLAKAELDPSVVKSIALAAVNRYMQAFPETTATQVTFYTETKHVEVEGGLEPRLYSWKQLGFSI